MLQVQGKEGDKGPEADYPEEQEIGNSRGLPCLWNEGFQNREGLEIFEPR